MLLRAVPPVAQVLLCVVLFIPIVVITMVLLDALVLLCVAPVLSLSRVEAPIVLITVVAWPLM